MTFHLSEIHEHVMHHLFRPSVFVINILKFSLFKSFIGYTFQAFILCESNSNIIDSNKLQRFFIFSV